MKFKEVLEEKLKTGMDMYAESLSSYLVTNEKKTLEWLNTHYKDTDEVFKRIIPSMSTKQKEIVIAIINNKKF